MKVNKLNESRLSQQRLKEILCYFPLTGMFVWMVSVGNVKPGIVAGCIRKNMNGKSYREIMINGKIYQAHRLAFLSKNGSWPAGEVDHNDGNGLNNKWNNLCDVTHAINQKNRRLNSNNRSGHIGVFWNKAEKKWYSEITSNGKRIKIGGFTNKQEAIAARKQANTKYGFHANHGQSRPL